MKRPLIAVLIGCLLSAVAAAENWPQWRGPHGNGRGASGSYPLHFSADENIHWKVELPGRGSSTPAVWGGQIMLTCPIDGQDGLVCYDFAGEELWRQQLGPQLAGRHRNGTGCNPSPVTDGRSIVTYFKSGRLACFNLAGVEKWQLNLQDLYGKDTLWWDLGTSPVLVDNKVVISVLQAGDSFLVALDLSNGKVVWKQSRQFECAEESDQAYTTPCVTKLDGRDVIVTWGADHLTGHDAATGESLWQCGGFNPNSEKMWRVIASAAVDDSVAVVPYGRGDFLAGINLRHAAGDITESHRLWVKEGLGSDVPTPLLDGDHLLLLTDKGQVHCVDKMTGNPLWAEQLPRGRDKYYASPILAGDTLYCTREDGTIMVGRLLDSGLQIVAENAMGEAIIATPIPIRGKLLVRGERHLFLVGN